MIRKEAHRRAAHLSLKLLPQFSGWRALVPLDGQRATTKGTLWCVLCPGHVADLTLTSQTIHQL